MSFLKSLRRTLFRWQQTWLYSIIRTQIIGPSVDEFNLDPSKPVVYALLYRSRAEQLVIDREVRQFGWPAPRLGDDQHQLDSSPFFPIYRRAGAPFRKRATPVVHRYLVRHCQWLQEHDADDIQVVPVRVFWGRAPDKEGSFLRIWLQNSGTLGGRLTTLMAILLNGRNTFVHFSKPLSLRELSEDSKSPELLARKVARVLRVHNRHVSASVLGPDLSHRRTLVHKIPHAPTVVKAIEEEVTSKGISRQQAQGKALKYADEIASNISYTNVRFLDVVLTWVWNKIYDGVQVHNIDHLKEVSKDNAIIYVPCHRSHIDYLLLSYLLYHQGLQLPQIAAGINLNMPIVGPILRRGGAFFMRRTFRDNPLYSAVFDQYLHTIFTHGYATEYFVEGGRSRTGRTLNPKAGMLAMTLRSYLRDSRKPILFVPVYTGYEKVFEAGSYLGELRGKKKQKESLLGVLGTLRSFRKSFGKVHVTFGEPIYLTQFLDQQQPGWQQQNYQECDFRPQWARDVVDNLALKVVTEINRATSVNPINLVALSILASPRQAMEEAQLIAQMDAYKRLMEFTPYSPLTQLPEGNGQDWLSYAEQLEVVSRSSHPMGDLIQTNERQAVTLTYYRNNVLHLYALPSLLACLFISNDRYQREEVIEMVQTLYPFLQAELFLQWPPEALPELVQQWLEALVGVGYLYHGEQGYHATPAHSDEFNQLNGLAGNMLQTLQRYYLTISLIQHTHAPLDAAQLEERATLLAQRIGLLYGINSPEFFDKQLFRTLIRQLLRLEFAQEGDDGKLQATQQMPELLVVLEGLLDGALRQSIQRSVVAGGNTPTEKNA
ncbi:glycerol-3-phosphate 1-O-acyltransferase [Bacterioplanes sanyensis]|uniref:Glycerol-3-phosphate acyltransferase n=1 Tax=Bacterioplanes sanyensis TaxID=1249553 RepID=A0A222FL14_9GAMM|nr:glycerol-3-phosphate 1-O-acyltransferase PlsB [Bacterioplanes sanyensis]ASP39214.1 glycerol-3-phosphate 1-O-acyltransferase [Bacterioplanes sanyensis]